MPQLIDAVPSIAWWISGARGSAFIGTLGILSHRLYFIRGEHHLQTLLYLRLWCFVNTSLVIVAYLSGNTVCTNGRGESNRPALLAPLLLLNCTFFTGLYGSIITYRVFEHPLRQFNGPRLAPVSKFWHLYNVFKRPNHIFLHNLHQKYGEFVRTGPQEITVINSDILQLINGPATTCIKAPWYDMLWPYTALNSIRRKDGYASRRKRWDEALGLTTTYMDPKTTPALQPPLGVEPNFVNPDTLQPALIAVSVVTLSICTLGIAARSYTRAVILKQFDLNDCALLIAGILFAAFTAMQLVAGNNGQGKHQWNITQADLAKLLLYLNIIEILYGPTMFFSKYVVLRQIESIFLNHRRQDLAYKVVRILIWVNLAFYAAISISFMVACVPRERIWNTQVEGRCIDTQASIIATSAINVVSDLTIFIIPMLGIWKLQIPLARKFGAVTVFAVGVLVIISSIIRLYYSVILTQTEDLSWAIEPVACWALAEFTTVILAACFPCFPRLFSWLRKHDPEPQYNSSSSGATKTPRRQEIQSEGYELRYTGSTTALRIRYWYNDGGGSDGSGFTRNFINALGFTCFGIGALEIALDHELSFERAQLIQDQTLTRWQFIIAAVVLTTVHTQDMPDQKGDAAKGRVTLPLQIGDIPARWTITILMATWGFFCPYFWKSGWLGYSVSTPLALAAAYRILAYRTIRGDRFTFMIWNLWMVSLYSLPLLKGVVV
ncbi:hypothetical protein F4814DRAFT_455611 [Daldinia grandis]|nr:hypothetical protein F4814DRAFT_455611 [Daldinia grandis]